ncbi:MAG TPA: hypothetical protein ACFCUD_11175 [Cyclobacteriaceae bacterium]
MREIATKKNKCKPAKRQQDRFMQVIMGFGKDNESLRELLRQVTFR